MMLLGAAGSLSLGLAPIIVAALSGPGGLTTGAAGQCISAEMAGSFIGAALAIFRAHRFTCRSVALIALLIIFGGNLASDPTRSFQYMIIARFVAGLGCGLTTAAYGMLAATSRPTRNFALYAVFAVLVVAVADELIPRIASLWGSRSAFLLIALIAAIAFLSSVSLSRRPLAAVHPSQSTSPLWSRASVLAGLMTLFFFTSLGGFWAYAAQIGISKGYSSSLVTTTLSSGFLGAGIAGSLLAAYLDGRSPSLIAILWCTVITGSSVATVILLAAPAAFVIGIACFILAWFTAYPFFMGALAQVDSSGRLAMAGVLIQSAGYVIGPLLVGSFVEQHQFGRLIPTCLIGFALALLCTHLLRSTSSTLLVPSLRGPS